MTLAGILDTLKPASKAVAPKVNVDGTISDLLTGSGFNLITFVFFLVGMLFFVNLIIAAWEYITSAGDMKKVASATSRLLNNIVGLVVTLSSFLLVKLIAAMIGLKDLI
ncbi:hypothetical protein HY333_01615 [Candidatus Collierbacteria bacterium]|nr:hypothetical protein [Candidatus Collierbacteria bacterium]